MLAKALSCAVVGLDSALVEVEVDLSPGLPSFQIVGTEYLYPSQLQGSHVSCIARLGRYDLGSSGKYFDGRTRVRPCSTSFLFDHFRL